jgi:hypothetical protein
VNDEIERMWKEEVSSNFKVLYPYWCGETEENYKNL